MRTFLSKVLKEPPVLLFLFTVRGERRERNLGKGCETKGTGLDNLENS